MKVKAHHLAASFFAGAIFLSTLLWVSMYTPSAIATCSGGANITIGSIPAGATLSGTFGLIANSTASPAPNGVTFVVSAPATQVIGQGGQVSSGSTSYSSWSYGWDTRMLANGGYQISAIAHYSGGSAYDCNSSPVAITILNPTTVSPSPVPITSPSPTSTNTQVPKLSVSVSPNNWQGAPGMDNYFTVSGVYVASSGAQFPVSSVNGAIFQWDTNAGLIGPSGQQSTTLTLGPAAGSFVLGVNVTMNGISSRVVATIKVVVPTATTTSPSPSPILTSNDSLSPSSTALSTSDSSTSTDNPIKLSDLSPAQIQILSTMPTVFRPLDPTNSRPVVAIINLACLELKLGTRFAKISGGTEAAKPEERLRGSTCFSGSDRIPSSLAPVEPTKIKEIPTTTSIVTISEPKNETITNKKGDKIAAILISGTGAPDSDIYIYIFSDPMVLRAQTDKSGKWNYSLQNPLKVGHHEIYAVAAKDSATFVRTSAVPVSIAAAANGAQDGSLVIESSLKPIQAAYIAGAILMVLAAIFLLLRIRRAHPHGFGVDMVHPGATPAAEMIHPVAASMVSAVPKKVGGLIPTPVTSPAIIPAPSVEVTPPLAIVPVVAAPAEVVLPLSVSTPTASSESSLS